MTPQERERFEEWHFVEFGWHPTVPEGGTDYLDVAVRKLWKAWQARAALDAQPESAPAGAGKETK